MGLNLIPNFKENIKRSYRYLYSTIQNSLYEFEINMNVPIIINKHSTLDLLITQNKSISRFGDGEFNLISGGSIFFQGYNEKLAKRLKDILKSNHEKVLIGIPDIFSGLRQYKKESKIYWRNYLSYKRTLIYSLLDQSKIYYDANITRPYITLTEPYSEIQKFFSRWKDVWSNKEIVIVEGVGNIFGGENDLLEDAKSIERIKAPLKNAFETYDDILSRVKKYSQNKLILISLGPTATVLSYDLCELGYQAIDIGHLNGEYALFKIRAKNKNELPLHSS